MCLHAFRQGWLHTIAVSHRMFNWVPEFVHCHAWYDRFPHRRAFYPRVIKPISSSSYSNQGFKAQSAGVFVESKHNANGMTVFPHRRAFHPRVIKLVSLPHPVLDPYGRSDQMPSFQYSDSSIIDHKKKKDT